MVGLMSFAQLAEQIGGAPGPVRLVGIDGCGGAGKTTFAARLALSGEWPVVHTDDFASHDEPLEWWPRMLAQVVEPLLRGEPATFRPYDWERRSLAAEQTIRPAPVVIIEGVGATRRAWRDRLTTRIWLQTPRDVRLRRGLDRDGVEMALFWHEWMAAEDTYVAAEGPQAAADLVIDGNPGTPHEADAEFVVVSERRGWRAGPPRR